MWRLLVTLVHKLGFMTYRKEHLTQVFSNGRMLLPYRHFTEDFIKEKLILGRFLICEKSVLVLNLLYIKGYLKLHYEIKILLLLVIFLFAKFWQDFFFNEWFIEVTYIIMQGLGLWNVYHRSVFSFYTEVSITYKD